MGNKLDVWEWPESEWDGETKSYWLSRSDPPQFSPWDWIEPRAMSSSTRVTRTVRFRLRYDRVGYRGTHEHNSAISMIVYVCMCVCVCVCGWACCVWEPHRIPFSPLESVKDKRATPFLSHRTSRNFTPLVDELWNLEKSPLVFSSIVSTNRNL